MKSSGTLPNGKNSDGVQTETWGNALCKNMLFADLLPFQKRIIKSIDRHAIVICSFPRGNGKTTLAAHIAAREFQRSGRDLIVSAPTIPQCRTLIAQAWEQLDDGSRYRFVDSANRVRIIDRRTNREMRALGSSVVGSMGLVNCSLAIIDEPSSMHQHSSSVLWDALQTAQAKPASPLKLLVLSTLAPAEETHWFRTLVDSADKRPDVAMHLLQADPDKWRHLKELRRVNPLVRTDPQAWKALLDRRKLALEGVDEAQFRSYHLNDPQLDAEAQLLSPEEMTAMLARPVPQRTGQPLCIAFDIGAARSWSAATAVWSSGRVEALAACGSKPPIEKREKSDNVSVGSYRRLVDNGTLLLAEDRHTPPVQWFLDQALQRFGRPAWVIADQFKGGELSDECQARGISFEWRRALWKQSSEDISALRSQAVDGRLAVDRGSVDLLVESVAAARTRTDAHGNTCLHLKESGHCSRRRDDAAASLVLAAGRFARHKPEARATFAVVRRAA